MHIKTAYFKFVFLTAIVFIFSSSSFAQTTIVTGKLSGLTNTYLEYGMVGIAPSNDQYADNFVTVSKDGEYTISITEKGLFNLQFSMPSHRSVLIPIINNESRNVELNVTLPAYEYNDTLDNASVITELNDYDFSSAQKMNKQEDGTYTISIETDLPQLKYQLLKVAVLRSINGTMSEGFEQDSTGDFRSIITTKDNSARIVFDPAKLVKGSLEPVVEFNNSEFDKAFYSFYTGHQEVVKDASTELGKYYKQNNTIEGFTYNDNGYSKDLMDKISNAKLKYMEEFYKVAYIQLAGSQIEGYDSEAAGKYFESVPASSLAWSVSISAFFQIYSLMPRYKFDEYFDKFLDESNDKFIKVNILSSKIATAKISGNTEEYQKIRSLIETEYADTQIGKQILAKYPKESKIKEGVEIPDFEVVSLDNPEEKISKKSMLGKVYLIDFWATWCGPCVGEMENLHKTFEKYKDKGFEIVSLSLDRSVDEVNKFRQGDWNMPWKNGFIGDAEGRKIADSFEVIGIPKPILVDKDGKILVLTNGLRGEKLIETIGKYYK